MQKGYYIHFGSRRSIGVSKKIDWQLKEFGKYYEMEEIDIDYVPRTIVQRVLGLFPTASISREYEKALEKINNPRFLYVRRTVCDRDYLMFWKEIKRRFPECKIIIEIFTYPYDRDDFAKWNAWPFLLKELIYRPKLKKYIDRFVTYSSDTEIFGIPAIVTTNGIIVDDVRELAGACIPKTIRMIGVAYMQRQHGYERIIRGLAEYYKNPGEYKITASFVGDGPEKEMYQKLAYDNGLSDVVSFYPTTSGAALDDLYDKADISLAAFGMYKVGYHESIGAIKTRECLAKGIPMASGSPVTNVEDGFKYLEIFENDNSPIDMKRIISFYENVYSDEKSRDAISGELREYARNHVAMDVVMKPIIDFIEE